MQTIREQRQGSLSINDDSAGEGSQRNPSVRVPHHRPDIPAIALLQNIGGEESQQNDQLHL